MKLKTLGVLIVLFVFCCSTKCQDEKMKVAFISDQNGLKAEHKSTTPLVEVEFCMPDMPACEVKRVYPDGSLYLLNRENPDAPLWAYLTMVQEAGLMELNKIFASVCNVNETPGKAPAELGSCTYRFQTADCGKEVMVYGLNYGGYAPLQKVTNAINFNLVQYKGAK
jgi:hypothetical protein